MPKVSSEEAAKLRFKKPKTLKLKTKGFASKRVLLKCYLFLTALEKGNSLENQESVFS